MSYGEGVGSFEEWVCHMERVWGRLRNGYVIWRGCGVV